MARQRPSRPRRFPILVALLLATACAVALGFKLMGRVAVATATTTTSSTTSTTARETSTTTTIAVGSLPQTRALPPAITLGLTRRMRALLAAVASGDASHGIPAFFPVQAYAQTKIYSDAAHDWATRLVPEFGADVHALHVQLDPAGAPMRLLGYAVDDAAAVWVLPGEEFNKGPYWRVYYTTVAYGIGAHRGEFTVNTLISWRGEWYVAHIANFNV
jgi:hypothetical protein